MKQNLRNVYIRCFSILLTVILTISMTGCDAGTSDILPQPASGTLLSGYAPKDAAELTMTLTNTASSVVMLKDTSGRTLMSFFVRAGDTVTVDVPAEMMYIHFASGNTWYGEEKLFGKNTVYKQDPNLFDFVNNNWEYELDPLSVSFEQEENKPPLTPQNPAAEQPDPEGYIADLGGEWESVYIKDGNSSLNVYALSFSEMVYNCKGFTVNMNVTMNAGTNCKNWQVWGRTGNTFVKLGKVYLEAGDGYTSQAITFDDPVNFNAIAVTPTIPGGYSWSLGLSITDVYLETY